jgi:hypothetical protein
MKEERNFVDEALLKRFPTLRPTVNKAHKLGVYIYAHRALFSKRGAVYQHWLYTKEKGKSGTATEWRHQDLKNWLDILNEVQDRVNEAKERRKNDKTT